MTTRALLNEAMQDGRSGRGSSKRVGLLIATCAMSLSLVILSIAALSGHEVSMAMGAVAVPLAGLNGYSYVGGKMAEKPKEA